MKLNSLIVLALATCWSIACSPDKNSEKQPLTTATTPSTAAPTKSSIQVLSVEQFAEKMSATPSLQLVDVRTPAEFAAGHLENAINIDVNRADFVEVFKKNVRTEHPVFLYCKSGSRSAKAAKIATSAGFQQIYNLDGGYLAWSSSSRYQAPDVSKVTDR